MYIGDDVDFILVLIYTPVAISTPVGGCIDGEVQLADGTSLDGVLEGRLEVCINNAWGTVCDSRFGTEDAMVACAHLGGYSREGECSLSESHLCTLCRSIGIALGR